jgi:hypothetical protein
VIKTGEWSKDKSKHDFATKEADQHKKNI